MRTILSIVLTAMLAGSAVAREVYVDNVVVVLDASGSMKDLMQGSGIRKIDAAKAAIKEVLKYTPPSTQVGLLVFGQSSRWEYPLGPRNDGEMFAAIDRVAASGGTPLGKYMKKGTDRLLKARQEQFGYGSYRLLVVTDGEASDQDLVTRYTPDIVSRGVVVDVIGVDMRQDHTLAKKVHSYRRANDPASLKEAVKEVFAEVGSAADGLAGEAAFEELQGLPNEAAMAIISSLAATGNDPIGGRIDVANKPQPQRRRTASAPVRPKSGRKNGLIVLVVAVVIGVQLVKYLIKKG